MSSATSPQMLSAIKPKPSSDSAVGSSQVDDNGASEQEKKPSLPKRKRSFVALACAACRKRKTKCDGRRPICSPCEQRHVECLYDFPDDVPAARRGKRAIERLSKANVDLTNVIATLRAGTEEEALAIVRQIRAASTLDNSLEQIADSAETSKSFNTVDQNTSEDDITIYKAVSPPDPLDSGNRIISREDAKTIAASFQPSSSKQADAQSPSESGLSEPTFETEARSTVNILPLTKWTTVTGTDKQFSELLTLLWTWDTTFSRMFDRGTFEEDLRAGAKVSPRDSSDRQFCSTFLVNAMLGFACVYTTDESTFAKVGDPLSRGRHFIDCADSELSTKKAHPSFDLLQGLTMLFAYEARIGDASKAKEHLEAVFDTFSQLEFNETEVKKEIDASALDHAKVFQAKAKIVWGLYIFDWRLAHTYGTRKRLEKPAVRKAWQELRANIASPDAPEYYWFQWPRTLSQQRSHYRAVYDAECHLIEIAEDIMKYVYPNAVDKQKGSSSSSEAVHLYHRLQGWKNWFRDSIHEDAMSLPQTLHVSYCYDMIVIALLRKVSHLTKEELGINAHPQSVCFMHTNNIMSTLWTYRALYTIRYEYWATQACSLVAFSTIFHLELNTVLQDSFEKACIILWEISQVYPIAADFLFSIRFTVEKHDIRISKLAREYLSKVDRPRQQELTGEWRAPIILGKDEGTRGGLADVSLKDITEGFNRLRFQDQESE